MHKTHYFFTLFVFYTFFNAKFPIDAAYYSYRIHFGRIYPYNFNTAKIRNADKPSKNETLSAISPFSIS